MGTISVKTVLGLLLIAAILFGFFFLLRRYLIPYLWSRKAIKKTAVNVYAMEALSWISYLIFGIYQLLSESLYITCALLVLIILAGLNVWRDGFLGIVFRLENKFDLGDPVRYDAYSGVLQEINRRNIQIKTDKEELVIIPFRKLSKAVFVKRQAKGKLHSSELNLHMGTNNQNDIVPQINTWLYECPWAIVNEETKIKVIDGGLLQLTVYAVDMISIQKIEEFLQQRIQK